MGESFTVIFSSSYFMCHVLSERKGSWFPTTSCLLLLSIYLAPFSFLFYHPFAPNRRFPTILLPSVSPVSIWFSRPFFLIMPQTFQLQLYIILFLFSLKFSCDMYFSIFLFHVFFCFFISCIFKKFFLCISEPQMFYFLFSTSGLYHC